MNNTEKDLITSAINGNQEDFKKLIDMCLEKSRPVIQNQYKIHHHDLNDVTQVVAIKIWNKLQEFRFESSFYTWFFTIFKHEALNFVKKKQKIEKFEQPLLAENEEHEPNYDYVSGISLDDRLHETALHILEKREEAVEHQKAVETILSKMSPKHSQILSMITMERKSYDEVAKALNLSVGTVMSRLFYARKSARKLINEYSRVNKIEFACMGRS